MENTFGLSPEHYRVFSRWHKIVAALLLLLLALLWLAGYGPGKFLSCADHRVESPSAALPAPAPASIVAEPAPAQVDASAQAVSPTPEQAATSPAIDEKVSEAPTVSLTPSTSESRRAEHGGSTVTALATRVYFPRNNYRLPNDTPDKLQKIVAYLKANPTARVQISGYHDRAGRLSYNAELASKRATEVVKALESAGVPTAQLQLQRPSQTRGSGKPEEARRVELQVTN